MPLHLHELLRSDEYQCKSPVNSSNGARNLQAVVSAGRIAASRCISSHIWLENLRLGEQVFGSRSLRAGLKERVFKDGSSRERFWDRAFEDGPSRGGLPVKVFESGSSKIGL